MQDGALALLLGYYQFYCSILRNLSRTLFQKNVKLFLYTPWSPLRALDFKLYGVSGQLQAPTLFRYNINASDYLRSVLSG
jgi:hypothetical protein